MNDLVTRSLETPTRSNDLVTRSIETPIHLNDLVTRSLETLTRLSDLVTHLLETPIRSSDLVTRLLKTPTRSNDLVTRSLKTSTHSNDLATRSLETATCWIKCTCNNYSGTRCVFSFAFLHQLSGITFFVSLNIIVFFDCVILLYSCLKPYNTFAINNHRKKLPDDKQQSVLPFWRQSCMFHT